MCVTVVADLDDGLKWLLVGDRFLMIFARHLYDTLRNVDVHVFHSVGTGWNHWNNDFLVILWIFLAYKTSQQGKGKRDRVQI